MSIEKNLDVTVKTELKMENPTCQSQIINYGLLLDILNAKIDVLRDMLCPILDDSPTLSAGCDAVPTPYMAPFVHELYSENCRLHDLIGRLDNIRLSLRLNMTDGNTDEKAVKTGAATEMGTRGLNQGVGTDMRSTRNVRVNRDQREEPF